MAWFYDTEDSDNGTTREIARIYCFLLDSFEESDWAALRGIYEKLPQPQLSKTVPYWFGMEETGNYLWASVEPVGLQIAGTLREEDWLRWETIFNEQVKSSSLPRYEVQRFILLM